MAGRPPETVHSHTKKQKQIDLVLVLVLRISQSKKPDEGISNSNMYQNPRGPVRWRTKVPMAPINLGLGLGLALIH
eukprot:scaffold112868_cov31-Tisochrysis_lutea.AAC.8